MNAKRLARADRVQQLLDVAERLFAVHGYEACSIEQVAVAAGITRPVVYEHFGSKDGLYFETLKRSQDQAWSHLAAHVTGEGTLIDFFREMAEGTFEFVAEAPDAWEICMEAFGSNGPPGTMMAELMAASSIQIADLIQGYCPEASREMVEVYAEWYAGGGEKVLRYWRRHPEIPASRMIDHTVQFMARGVGALDPPGAP